MAQFRYRLQTLLDQKMRAKEEAQHALAAAQRDLRTEEEELEACRRAEEAAGTGLRNARAEMLAAGTGGVSGEWMRMRRGHVARLADACEAASDATRAQELNVSEAEERLAAARETLSARSRDVEVLEKHRARLERRFNEEAARKEALDQEEMANLIYLRGKSAT